MLLAKTTLAAVAILGFTAIVPARAQEHPACSNATLRGDYAFTITGQILAPAPAAGLVSGVAMTHFDGDGKLTQFDHVLHNGIAPAETWRPGSGPYHVNADCTGYMTITPEPTVPSDASPVLTLYFVIGNNGSDIRTVVSGSPTSPAFSALITSTATKVYQFPSELPW
jgi:hypothetical protein